MTNAIPHPRLHLACAAIAAIVLHSCIPEPAFAATPLQLRWTAELSDPKPYNAVLFAGESADLQATLKLYGRAVALETNATAALYWQTNGMASAWWSVPATVTTAGVVTASWTPDMDAGADLYRWHIGVANAASSTVYRAFGAFRMQPSPGAAPNVLAPPVRWIDFDLVAISNAPWATPADVAAATEGMLVEESDPVAGAALSAHADRADNPHSVTAAQVGALPLTGGVVFGTVEAKSFSTETYIDEYMGYPGSKISVFPTYIRIHNDFPNIDGVSIYGDRISGINDYGKSWSAYYPTNRTGRMLITEYDIESVTNWVESIRGVHADIATNVVYHVVVSNGHWLIREVQ